MNIMTTRKCLPGGTMVKNPPTNVGDVGSIPKSWKVPHAAEQIKPVCHNY